MACDNRWPSGSREERAIDHLLAKIKGVVSEDYAGEAALILGHGNIPDH